MDQTHKSMYRTDNGLMGYKMCLNGPNNTGNISNLPDFNVTIKLNNNTGLFRSDIALFRFSHFMNLGDSFDVSAKDPWNDTINNTGNYTFSALVDNQQLNINLAARINSSLSLNATNIIYGDNASINATLTDSNGSILSNRTIIFNINGNNYTSTTTTITDGSGVDVLNIGGLHAECIMYLHCLMVMLIIIQAPVIQFSM